MSLPPTGQTVEATARVVARKEEDEGEEDHRQQQQQQVREPPRTERRTIRQNDLLTRYLKLLDRRPLLAKSLTSAVIGALGGALGSHFALTSLSSSSSSDPKKKRLRNKQGTLDWLEVLSFAIYGGLVGGPLGHYWDEWLKENGPASRSKAMLLDQLVAQPPRLLLMYLVLDLTRAALRELPTSWSRSWSHQVSPAVALSWRVWPLATYLMLRIFKKRRHYTVAIHACALWLVTELARRRVALRQISSQ